MKPQVLIASFLLAGILAGAVIGGALVLMTSNTSNLDLKISDLQDQNAKLLSNNTNLVSNNSNLASHLDDLQNRTITLQSNVTNLSAQVANLSLTLNETRQALLLPYETFNYTLSPNGTANFTIVSITNIGVLPKFLSVTVTPSEGVTIGPWVTKNQWLLPGDNIMIYGLISGQAYMVTFKYWPFPTIYPSEGTVNYEFRVPQGTFNVTNNATGVYNISLTSISSNVKSNLMVDIQVNGTSLIGTSTYTEVGWDGCVLSRLHCGDYLAPGDYYTFTGGIPGTSYTIELLYFAQLNPSSPEMGNIVIAQVTFSIP